MEIEEEEQKMDSAELVKKQQKMQIEKMMLKSKINFDALLEEKSSL